MLGFERRNLTHDRNGSAITDHVFDVVSDVQLNLIETALRARNRAVHRVTSDVGGPHVALVDQFFFVADVIIERRVGQSENVRNVFKRSATVAFLIETMSGGLEHAVALQLESRFVGIA